MKLLRILAKTIGASRFSNDSGLTVIGIGGFSNWPSVEAFGWVKSELLGSAVEVRLLLDRDYRSDEACADLRQQLQKSGVRAHIWTRKEIESYLLEPTAIARLTGLMVEDVDLVFRQIAEDMKNAVVAQLTKSELDARGKSIDLATAMTSALDRAQALWTQLDHVIWRLPAKDVLSAFNRHLQGQGLPTLTPRELAASIRKSEIAAEMRQVFEDVEHALSTASAP